jgi:cytochrome c556
MKPVAAFLLLHPAVVMLILSWASSWHAPAYAGSQTSLDVPPVSLEKWYKPANKRQVWLHTMFRLRREMQAIDEYARQDDRAAMEKWIKRLEEDYSKIADMVPEWEKQIKPRLLPELKMFAEKGDAYRLAKTLKMIERTCDDCHSSYQPLVAAIYRSPHYDAIEVRRNNGTEQSFEDSMGALSISVNQILIALDDGHKAVALQASQNLAGQLQDLGDSCNSCHKDDEYPRERILGKATKQHFTTLQASISEGRVEDSQKLMGEIAVTVCARCHNTHRIVNDLRNALVPEE